MQTKYTKLSALVGKKFTINKVAGHKFKMWDKSTSHMVVADKYFDGAAKKYQVETEHGTLDLGTGQLGNLLEATFKDGKADLNGKTFEVKSNGKTGMEIRYYFNLVPEFEPEDSERAIAEHEAKRDLAAQDYEDTKDERGDDSAKDEIDLGEPF